MTEINLKTLPLDLSVCKLTLPGIPDWAKNSGFLNYTITTEEISLVCESHCVLTDINTEKNFRCIKVDGILDFSFVGIIAKITNILAQRKISVFVVSTFDTDYILMRSDFLLQAAEELKVEGYNFVS